MRIYDLYNMGQRWLDNEDLGAEFEADLVCHMALHDPFEFLQYVRHILWRSQCPWWRRLRLDSRLGVRLLKTRLGRKLRDPDEVRSPVFIEFSMPLRELVRDRSMLMTFFKIKDNDPMNGKVSVEEIVEWY